VINITMSNLFCITIVVINLLIVCVESFGLFIIYLNRKDSLKMKQRQEKFENNYNEELSNIVELYIKLEKSLKSKGEIKNDSN
jgi:uncharacterized Tic20 family protein